MNKDYECHKKLLVDFLTNNFFAKPSMFVGDYDLIKVYNYFIGYLDAVKIHTGFDFYGNFDIWVCEITNYKFKNVSCWKPIQENNNSDVNSIIELKNLYLNYLNSKEFLQKYNL